MSRTTDLSWQKGAICAEKQNEKIRDFFFSTEPTEKYQAKNLCFLCPVRKECLKWALEHRQIWGIWGGKDEVEIRRTLSVSYLGEETRRRRFPNCPYCTARPGKLETSVVQLDSSGRWNTAKVVTCSECGFAWKSRTSANAVDAYKAERVEKLERQRKEKEKAKKAKRPRKSSATKPGKKSPK